MLRMMMSFLFVFVFKPLASCSVTWMNQMIMLMMMMMTMIMMMKCKQKSFLNFFIFAPLNMLNVNFYQLVPRLSDSFSTSKGGRILFSYKNESSFFSNRNLFRKAWYQLLEVDTKHVSGSEYEEI